MAIYGTTAAVGAVAYVLGMSWISQTYATTSEFKSVCDAEAFSEHPMAMTLCNRLFLICDSDKINSPSSMYYSEGGKGAEEETAHHTDMHAHFSSFVGELDSLLKLISCIREKKIPVTAGTRLTGCGHSLACKALLKTISDNVHSAPNRARFAILEPQLTNMIGECGLKMIAITRNLTMP